MLESQAWTEKISYVECPYCDHLYDFGDDLVDQDLETVCEKCNNKFKILAIII